MKLNNAEPNIDEAVFEQAVRSAYQPISPPASEKSFQAVRYALVREQRKQARGRRYRMAVACIGMILFGALAFGSINESKAFAPFFQMIKEVRDDFVTFVIGGKQEDPSQAKTLPPTQELPKTDTGTPTTEDISKSKIVSLEQAREEMMFDFYFPEVVPEGFELITIELYHREQDFKAHMIELWFEDETSRSFSIMQRPFEETMTLSYGVSTSSGMNNEFEVLGQPAIFIEYNDKRMNLKFLLDHVLVDIAGELDGEKMLEMANSMK